MIARALLYLFIILAAASSFSILFVKNVLHSVLLLLVCLLCIAGIYVILYAEFLAVTQLLVYAGGIVVLILFGVMITRRISRPMDAGVQNQWMGYLTGATFLFILISSYSEISVANSSYEIGIRPIGISLMTDYVLPFEISGILLLVSLVGAAITAGTSEKK